LTLLQDYRDGSLGRVSLETPEQRKAMLLTGTGPEQVDEDELGRNAD